MEDWWYYLAIIYVYSFECSFKINEKNKGDRDDEWNFDYNVIWMFLILFLFIMDLISFQNKKDWWNYGYNVLCY